MDDSEYSKVFDAMISPKYEGINAFFTVLTLIALLIAIPVTVLMWRAAF